MAFDDRPEPAIRLEQAREARGFANAKAACNYFGWNYTSYSQHERGERGIGRAAAKYAKGLRVSRGWLVYGEGDRDPIDPPLPIVKAPIISWVSASDLATPDVVTSFEDAPELSVAGLDPAGDWIALKVDGTSMDRISPPDSIILVNRKDRLLVANACYVIATEDEGEASYKRFRPAPDRWEPVSTFDHPTLYPDPGASPKVVGRVRRTVLDL